MMNGKTINNLRQAFSMCGYDLDEIMRNHTQKRIYADLRSIAWYIYQDELRRNCKQISNAFGWHRSTISCALAKARTLISIDRAFRDKYDSILGFYQSFKEES